MQQPQPDQSTTPPEAHEARLFTSPGVSRFRLVGTIVAMITLLGVVLAIAAYEGVHGLPFVASTITGLLFMAGFVWYLKLATPVPFTLRVDATGLLKEDQRGGRLALSWDEVAGVKEQVFRSGKLVSIIIYREAEPHPRKALAIYRDDIDDIAAYRDAVRRWLPAACSWKQEQVMA
jgi:hypothetical protein